MAADQDENWSSTSCISPHSRVVLSQHIQPRSHEDKRMGATKAHTCTHAVAIHKCLT